MSMEGRLPFERGTYTCGAIEVGAEYYDPKNKQWLQVMKNTYTSALSAKTLVKWENPETYDVDLTALEADGPMVAGVVDPLLGSNTVPVNGYFFGVIAGVCTCAMGSGTNLTSGALLLPGTPNAAGNNGKLVALDAVAGAVGLLTTELVQQRYVCAVSHAVVSADSTNNAQIRLCLRR